MNLGEFQFQTQVLEAWPVMVWLLDGEGQPVYLNKLARVFCGTEAADSPVPDWNDRVFLEDRASYEDALHRGLEGGEGYFVEYRRRAGDGDYHRLAESGTPLEGGNGVFCVVSDLTANLSADSVASSGAAQVELLSQVTHDVVWDWDLRTNVVVCNAAFIESLGQPPSEYHAAHHWWRTRAHPKDIDRITALYDEAMKAGATSVSYEYRIRDRQDQYVTLDSRACLIRDSSGTLIRLLVASRDISKRRDAEQAQARFMRILEATTDYAGMATVDGYPFYINAAGRKMLGIELDEPLEFHLSACHPEWANEIILKEAIPTAIRDGYWRGENALLHRDGREIPVSQVLLSHRDADGNVEFISTIVRDLTDRKREEIERMEWANRYDAAIRASGQILFDWNSATNEITYAGDVERLFGYRPVEMAGGLTRFRELIDPADLPRFDERLQQITATRDPFHLEFRLRHKSGRWVYLDARGYFFLDRRGQIGRMVGFFADVTAERTAKEEIAQAHGSLEQRVADRTAELARASALLEDRAHRQEAVAKLGQRALGGEPLGKLMEEAVETIQGVLRVDRCALLALTHDGTELVVRALVGWPEEVRGIRVPIGRNSQSGYTLLTGEPVLMADAATETRFTPSSWIVDAGLKSGLTVLVKGAEGPLGVLATFTMAQRNFLPEDVHFLQSVANVLTAAIQRERAEESIRQAREQAELASRAKSEFLSRMSHELRTPLNAILGFTQLMELENVAPSLAESVHHISQAGKHLLSLINEVLDISRIDAGRFALALEPIDVRAFLNEALERIRNFAQRHNVTAALQVSENEAPPFQVLADRQRLHQVVFNLLSNAVKYNRPGGHVDVSYRADGPNVRIAVADTGRGIEPDKLARLFLPFERLGAESTDVEGAGIGLALSRGIVNALQGELKVESRAGEGSTFWVTLPQAGDQAVSAEEIKAVIAPIPPAPAKTAAYARHTLLYIEDQDLNLRLVERVLNPLPQYRLLTALQGGAGLNLAREQLPDLILLDLNLPDMTGDEVLHQLKSDPKVRHIPVIMVSADVMGDRIQHLLRLGASGYLTKPYKLEQFLKTIEDALAKKRGA
jgi:PAS domain S-box-containing protein